MAEHIAQEKARLKRIEHELSEKLKLFGRQREEGNRQPSVPLGSPSKSSKRDTSDSKKHERDKTQLPLPSERVGDSNANASEMQDLNSKEHCAKLTESQEKNPYATENLLKKGERPEAKLVTVSPEQVERIRKLQVSIVSITSEPLLCRTSLICMYVVFEHRLDSEIIIEVSTLRLGPYCRVLSRKDVHCKCSS